jgi:hypothetical protein
VNVTADGAAVRLAVGGGDRRTVVELEPADALGLANAVLEATRASRREDAVEPPRSARGAGRTAGDGPTPAEANGEAEFTRGGGADRDGRAGDASGDAEFTRGGGADRDGRAGDASGDAEFTRGGGATGDATGPGVGGPGREGRREEGRDVWTTCHRCGFSWTHSGGGSRTDCPACGTETPVGSY